MAGVDLASLTAPVSEAEPCGPDLDLEGDPDYLNFLAKAEGILPQSYFSVHDGKPFDRASIDFAAEFDAVKPLLERTRDLRLLVTVAKLHILNRDLSAFETCIQAIATLLDTNWDNVHPRGEGGDYAMRMAAIETLDDLPTVVHPLQFVPLVNHRRLGAITYRNHMVATGEIKPREDEEQQLDLGTIDKALMESEFPPLVELLRQFEALQSAFGRIRSVWIERAGFDQAVNLDKTSQIVGKLLSLVNEIVVKRDPSAARVDSAAAGAASAGGAVELPAGEIASAAEATEALAAVASYFSRTEPSNPALLLVRQAQQLVGRSLADAIRILVPAFADQAVIAIGTQHVFDLSIERLAALEQEPDAFQDEPAGDEPDTAQASPEAPAAEEAQDQAPPSEEPSSVADASEEAPSSEGPDLPVSEEEENALENPSSEESQSSNDLPEATPLSDAAPARRQRKRAATRQQAFTLMEQVAAYYRTTEPTSPIPIIIDRARHLAGRDFMSLLKDFLPESALRSTANE